PNALYHEAPSARAGHFVTAACGLSPPALRRWTLSAGSARGGLGGFACLASGLGVSPGRMLQPTSKGDRVDVVDEGPLAVDLHDGQPLAVRRLEFRVA